jgi:microcystin-dependent protein
MSSPFLSQILMFGGNFAPKNYALCNGQLMAINQNQALFALIGTTYGGNGQTNFALPNLQSSIPVAGARDWACPSTISVSPAGRLRSR